jgi:hypothetical protein
MHSHIISVYLVLRTLSKMHIRDKLLLHLHHNFSQQSKLLLHQKIYAQSTTIFHIFALGRRRFAGFDNGSGGSFVKGMKNISESCQIAFIASLKENNPASFRIGPNWRNFR